MPEISKYLNFLPPAALAARGIDEAAFAADVGARVNGIG